MNYELIGHGVFGCAFKKNNNIIKITSFNDKNKDELDINLFLQTKNKEKDLSKSISIIIKFTKYNINSTHTNPQNYQIKFIEGNNEYYNDILSYITKCNSKLETKLSMDNSILIQELPNSGKSLSLYIKNLLENKKGKINEIIDSLRICINKSLSSLKVLHSLNIVHGDFHLDNILIDEEGECRIIDFGKSSIIEVKDNKIITVINKQFIEKLVPNITPECIFVLDKIIILFSLPKYIHSYNKSNIKNKINEYDTDKENNKTYFNTIDNLFKIDLYNFGNELDLLLYPIIYEDMYYVINTSEFKRVNPDTSGMKDYGIIDLFIQKIADIDYTKRQLLYEVI